MARQIEVVVSGRHAASGDFGQIRRLMTDRPVQYVVVSDDDRASPAALIAEPSVVAVSLRRAGGVDVSVSDFGAFTVRLPAGGPAARHPDPRAHPDRRVARERLRLPGGWLTDEPHDPPALRPGAARPPARLVLVLIPAVLLVLAVVVRAPDRRRGRLRGGASASASPSPCRSSPCSPRPRSSAPRSTTGRSSTCSSKPVSRHVIAPASTPSPGPPRWCSAPCRSWSPGWSSTRRTPARRSPGASAARWPARRTPRSSSALAAFTRHAVVIGLLFALLWEGVLGNVLDGIRWVAIGAWGREVAAEISPQVAGPGTGLGYALVAAAAREPSRRCGSPATGCGPSPCAATSSTTAFSPTARQRPPDRPRWL